MKITIARECGCYGDEVGQVLADRLNVPLYNKKTLTELAKKKGILEHYPDYFGENPAGTLLAVIAEDDGEDSVVHRTPRKVLCINDTRFGIEGTADIIMQYVKDCTAQEK